MQFLVSEKIGPKRSWTPEGYLICFEVPIARLGTMDYAGVELPELEDKDGIIVVERGEDVLFSKETIASFELKPITINHPAELISPATWMVFSKGSATNVRRGDGEQANLLLADLLIMDKYAIHQVQNGLVEVSPGYDADYKQISPGRAAQTTIVGNHVALVKSARCGSVCSIGDSSMPEKKSAQPSIADKLRKLFMTRDSDEFEKTLAEVKDSDAEVGAGSDAQHIHIHMPEAGTKPEATQDADEVDPNKAVLDAIAAVGTQVTALCDRVTKLEGAGATTDSDEDVDTDTDTDTTTDSDEEVDKDKPTKTGDSTAFRDEFQDAKARAEILAPGVKLPTFDAKAVVKKTTDSICVLRRRALIAALDNDNADLVKAVTGGADVSKMTCDSTKAFFNAASELVKQKNSRVEQTTKTENQNSGWSDINKRNAEFWSNRK